MQVRRLLIRLVFVAAVPGILALGYLWRAKNQIASLKQQCEAAYQAQEWEPLERAALSWFEWQPEIARPLIYAAHAATERGDLLMASVYLSQLPDDDSETIPGLLELSDLQFGPLNQPLAAAETWQRILRIAPQNSEAHRRLIFFYAMSRMRDKLLKEVRRGIEVNCDVPETYLYLFGADWMTFTNGADVNTQWLQSVKGYEHFEVARIFHHARTKAMSEEGQEDAEGVSAIEQQLAHLLELHPGNQELLAYHLDLATYRSEAQEVVSLLKKAPAGSVNDSRFWRYKGWVHGHRGELQEGIAAYEKALELYPYDNRAHHELATLYRRANNLDEVARHRELSSIGGDIMRACLQMPSTDELSTELLAKMAQFAKLAGDTAIAEKLLKRLNQRNNISQEPPAKAAN